MAVVTASRRCTRATLVSTRGTRSRPLSVAMIMAIAMIIATLNGLDRVPRVLTKVARVHRLDAVTTAMTLQLPAAAPYLFTGVKPSASYGFLTVIAAEVTL